MNAAGIDVSSRKSTVADCEEGNKSYDKSSIVNNRRMKVFKLSLDGIGKQYSLICSDQQIESNHQHSDVPPVTI